MKPQPPLLARLWRKLFPGERPKPPVSTAVHLSSGQKPLPKRSSRLDERGIEPLEGRIAPAALSANGLDLKYTDADHDLVTIHFSKSIFIAATGTTVDSILSNVFTFSAGKAHTGAVNGTDDVPQLLEKIDLTQVRPNASVTPASGVSFTISAVKVGTGDGFANVGAINATGLTLGSIVVPGDLGQIDVGNANNAVALTGLKVQSLGKLTNTQTGTASFESTIVGALTTFSADSIDGAYLHVTDGNLTGVGKIGTATIAHYIKATSTSATATHDGLIETDGDIGTLTIGSGASDGLFGGVSATSGAVKVGGQIGKLVVNGDLRGSTGTSSASIAAEGAVGSLQVAGALIGSGASSATISGAKFGAVSIGLAHNAGLVGGQTGSGVLISNGPIASLTISNILGNGPNSGGVTASGAIGNVTVTGNIVGGSGAGSGFIISDGSLGAVKITADLMGGAGSGSGVVTSGGTIVSFAAHTVQGSGADSGGVSAPGKIGSVTLSASLIGGAGQHSGFIDSDSELGPIKILGSIDGGTGVKSGAILSGGKLGAVTITGHVKGGDATTTAGVTSGGDFSGTISSLGPMASISIGDGLIGGSALGSGVISSDGTIGTITIARVAPAGTILDAILGGTGESSGEVFAFGPIGSAVIKGSIHGGAGDNSGTLQEQGILKSVAVSGSVLGGSGDGSGAIRALDNGTPENFFAAGGLGTVVIHGTITGGTGLRSGVVSSDGAITSLTTAGLFAGSDASSGQILSAVGFNDVGTIGTLSLGQVGTATAAGGSVAAYGGVLYLNATQLVHGTLHVANTIGQLNIAGNVDHSTVTAGGQPVFNGKTDLTIGKIAITGSVTASSIFAGYGVLGDAENGHAQIGAVTVKGNWVSSNLVAGVRDANGNGFADAGDRLIPGNTSTVKARIASVVISGLLDAGTASGQSYGFVSQEIGSFKAGPVTAALTAAPAQSFTYTGPSGGVISVREVAA